MKTKNSVTLIGFCASEPEVREYGNAGGRVGRVRVATSRGGWTRDDGTGVPEVTQWHTVVFWNNLCNVAERMIQKGTLIAVDGRIEYREVEREDGTKSWFTDIVAEDLYLLRGLREGDAPKGDTSKSVTADATPF